MQPLIYLIRHGEVDTSLPRRFLGQTDLALNGAGIRQALGLRQRLRQVPFSAVFSSPLQRAVQTAALISGQHPEAINRIEAFREIHLGAWEGLTVEEVRCRYPGAYEQRGRDLEQYRPENGESFGDLAARCLPALAHLAAAWSGPVLIVAHAGVIRVLLSRLQGLPLQHLLRIPQEYGAINILRQTARGLEVVACNLGEGSEALPPVPAAAQ